MILAVYFSVLTRRAPHTLQGMRTLFGLGSTAVLALAVLVGACGDGPPESHVEGGAAQSSGGSTTPSAGQSTGGTPSFGSNGPSLGGTTSNGGDGAGGIEQCAAANEQAELSPVYLVFLLDESGSMGDGEHGNRAEKWDPVTAALKSFFADQESSGIMASLSLFPLNQNKTTGPAKSSQPADCNSDAYVDPVVTPTALPNTQAFADAIAVIDPPNEYGTPTTPALTGTIKYAESLLAEDPARKVAIVMVTDGEPVSCSGNTIANTAKAAERVASTIPTYVIGVGEELASLDAIAKGGGTDAAFIVALDDPESTRTSLLNAINLIRGKSISCDLDIPAPPAGKTLDPDKVDVQFSGEGTEKTSLKYGTECTGDVAWRYDDPKAPRAIQLCEATCNAVKADAKGKLDVVFGCVDRVVVN